MFRIVIHAIWAVIYFLSFDHFFIKGSFESDAARKKTVKKRIMSNVSMALYWFIHEYLPFEIVKDDVEWETIAGDGEAVGFAFE
ncbi:uncharacterized protein LOC128263521 [Drosophila gunungcola]|uniref:uncharacterized protein LOC128263521 n=1 Tax=Drosophila gunungcola TaxID=103775 RepID=UPI0022E4CA4F|nr:uncharacterized protein LOC128263521 [Drosophila gunungcola]